ncbi:MAG: methylmalonyl-CoA epimerase [Propionibacteriaceae bacterium]|jgi:methylmalonyl-CoA/ethylmalonyl-CoA epimerase|nr:methylmalonyl-CoA epimerase [Propionibacteriaceae bacterium]
MTDLFNTIDHVAIAYPDLDEAVAYYTERLGWYELHRETNEEQGVHEAMLSPVKDWNPIQTRVQLIAPAREDSTVAKWLEKNRPGMHHIAFRVEDIDAAMVELAARGFAFTNEKPRRGTADSRINFLIPKTANGVLTEIVEPAK